MTRLLLAFLGTFALTAFASSRAADPPSVKGTWVRESMAGPTSAHQVIVTLTDHRVSARFRSGGREDGGKEVWMTVEFEGDYARTDSGLLVGSITGMNVDLSQAPDMHSLGEPFGKSLTKIIGEPFSFRARVVDGALTVTDLKVPNVMIDDELGSREMIAAFASGKYVSSPTENVPLPKLKVAKVNSQNHSHIIGDILGIVWNTCTPRSLPSVKNDLPSPKYLDHYPEYFQPDPVFPPQVMVPGPVPGNGNSTPAMPVTMAPQPMPWAMPNLRSVSSQPMPMPYAMPSSMVPQPMPRAMPALVALSPQPIPTVMPASMATMTPPPMPQYLSAEGVPGNFFYFRPCRVEETFTMADRTMISLQIVLPVTPAFVPQPVGIWGGGDAFDDMAINSKIIVSIPSWLGTEVMPMAQAMQIPTIAMPMQATFVPQPQQQRAFGIPSSPEFIFGHMGRAVTQSLPPSLSDYYVPTQCPGPVPVEPNASTRAEQLMFHGFHSGPGSVPLKTFPDNIERVEGGIMDDSKPSRETVIREIDLGEAGTMQVIVRIKGDKAKGMLPPSNPVMAPMRVCPPETVCPSPSPVSQFPMQPPVPSTLIPTAGQLLPPGSMRNVPVMPAIADAWKNSTRIEGGIMK